VKKLYVNCFSISAETERIYWSGDGGPRAILCGLYQILNEVLYCGPLVYKTTPLARHLHLRELALNFVGRSADVTGKPGDAVYRSISCGLWQLEYTGLLSGYVNKLQVISDGGEINEKVVRQVDDARVPRSWWGYGFDWGVGERSWVQYADA